MRARILLQVIYGGFNDQRIKCPAKTSISSNNNQSFLGIIIWVMENAICNIISFVSDIGEHPVYVIGIWSGFDNTVLSFSKLGGSHHFHGISYLPGIADTFYSILDISDTCHLFT
jgi:hypothetical protein